MKIEIAIEGFRIEGNSYVFTGRDVLGTGGLSKATSTYAISADSVQMISSRGSFLTVYMNSYLLCGYVSSDVDMTGLSLIWGFR